MQQLREPRHQTRVPRCEGTNKRHMKKLLTFVAALTLSLATPLVSRAADHLKLAPGLDYMKNRVQGPIITGENMGDGIVKGMPNYIFFYGEFCYNAKREALRTIELYRDYGDRVHFVIINVSQPVPIRTQMPLVNRFFTWDFPHTTILDKDGKVVFDYTGEVDAATLFGWMDAALSSGAGTEKPGAEPAVAGAGK